MVIWVLNEFTIMRGKECDSENHWRVTAKLRVGKMGASQLYVPVRGKPAVGPFSTQKTTQLPLQCPTRNQMSKEK